MRYALLALIGALSLLAAACGSDTTTDDTDDTTVDTTIEVTDDTSDDTTVDTTDDTVMVEEDETTEDTTVEDTTTDTAVEEETEEATVIVAPDLDTPDGVQTLQTALEAAGYNIGATGVDGVFGDATATALATAVEDAGIENFDGVLTAEIWTAITA